MTSAGIHEAKTSLSKPVRRVSAGKEITITRSDEPIAKFVLVATAGHRAFDLDAGRFEVPDDFDESLPGDALAALES
jgi:antitoxin (DNA-binding transcriptional repressor) of toxin-antitoxin stability system